MSKKCARCEKTVYPIEELKCLDKIWHKQCFKCQVCQMTLNMRNYKGFNKDPYCEAHIPKAKATTVAETPEYKRIAENTKIQSNVKYHAEFEKAKGKFTQVADDPETLRIKENSRNISNVAYHGELEKKALMEKQRNIGENGEELGTPEHQPNDKIPQMRAPAAPQPVAHNNVNSPYTARQSSTVIYTSDRGSVPNATQRPGSIQDLDPVNEYYGSLSGEYDNKPAQNHPGEYYNRSSQQNYNQQKVHGYPQQSKSNDYIQQPKYQQQQPQQQQHQQQQPPQQPNPYPNNYPVYSSKDPYEYSAVGNGYQRGEYRPPQNFGNEYQRSSQEYQPPPAQQSRNSGRVYRAMYDYKANDSDEVSFQEGDLIINCTPIDEGWLTGVVQRTGQSGMLPANYVQPAI